MAIYQVKYRTHGKTCFLAHFNTLQSALDRYRDKEHAAIYLLALGRFKDTCMSQELIEAKGLFAVTLAGEAAR